MINMATESEVDKVRMLLANLAYCGYDDFGGSYVNLQVSKEDVIAAREYLVVVDFRREGV